MQTPLNVDEEWHDLDGRRTSQPAVRMRAGLVALYRRASGGREGDPFPLTAENWAVFEQAALPELASYSFFDRPNETTITPNAVLANAMRQFWTADDAKPMTVVQAITRVTDFIAGHYEISPIDRRTRARASIGLDLLA